MRVILDANVLIAAVAGRGICESLLELCLEEHELIVSEELLGEVHRNLIKKIKLPNAVTTDFCRLLKNNGIVATPASVPREACRDPKDLYLLGLSKSAHAEYLVTGDKDLLECARYGATEIVTPRQFWEICRQR
jgi:putative PIN family toxin of toxin-antitoxin system